MVEHTLPGFLGCHDVKFRLTPILLYSLVIKTEHFGQEVIGSLQSILVLVGTILKGVIKYQIIGRVLISIFQIGLLDIHLLDLAMMMI